MKFVMVVFVLMPLSILQAFRARSNSRCSRMTIFSIDPDVLKVLEYLGPSIPTIAVLALLSNDLNESLEKQIASNKD